MSHFIVGRRVGKHWFLALVACALLVVSFAQVVHASGYWNYDNNYSYPNTNYSNYYGYTYPYSGDYYTNYYGYPTNYYPYGSHYSHYGYATQPSCSITITPAANYSHDTYRWGYPMQLTWSSSNATSASISPDVGSVSSSGSRVVYAKGQVYTMAVYGPGGTATCQTSSYSVPTYPYNYGSYNYGYPYTNYYTYPSNYYSPTYTHPTTYSYPATYTSGAANVVNNYVVGSSSSAKVALTQIPYTGADYGLWGTAFMYLAITLIAAYGAYALARRQGFVGVRRV